MKGLNETPQFSFFKSPVSNTKPTGEMNLEQVHQLITGETYSKITSELHIESSKEAKANLKSTSLDYVCFCGMFTKRANKALLSYSGYLVLDFDDLENPEHVREQIIQDKSIDLVLLFKSPSGNGLKVVVQTNGKQEEHESFFKAYTEYFNHNYGLSIDKSGKDLARACFLCHDPNAFANTERTAARTFDLKKWLPDSKTKLERTLSLDFDSVTSIIQEIENKRIDITSAYSDWVNIGFAFADEFGESGRGLFHRVSQFHPDYSTQECDKQFYKCINARGQGISLKTFFYHAKQAGVTLGITDQEQANFPPPSNPKSKNNSNEVQSEIMKEPEKLPSFPTSLFQELPELLKDVTKAATFNEERDILLLGALVSISACLPKVSGIYDGHRVYSNLFLFITAKASAGKGCLVYCSQLVEPIHKQFREEAKLLKQSFESEMVEFNNSKSKDASLERPSNPPEKMLFIPANNSATGAYQLLGDSDGKGLIFETEGDTLANAFKTDYSNYSDGFRKAFHHETISFYRRTDHEYVEIKHPCLSAVLSGTPQQIISLIPSAENGLFSRFIFYSMDIKPYWKDIFAENTENGLDEHFDNLSENFFDFYNSLNVGGGIKFTLTTDQKNQFNEYFSQVHEKYLILQGKDYLATIRRLGLIAYRFCIIFSTLRIMDTDGIQYDKDNGVFDCSTGEMVSKIVCLDKDFQASLTMIRVLVKHSSKVFDELPKEAKITRRWNKKERFLNHLPKQFNRQKYLEVAQAHSIQAKTAEGYITTFCKSGLIHRESQDNYLNTSIEEPEEVKETKDS
tara:strand:- start:31100 stop:33493 length:2394 start_codon:yes stop_codon:yes gene_type:complete